MVGVGGVLLDSIRVTSSSGRVVRVETQPIERERWSIDQVDQWLTELELEFYISEYSRSGFTGGLNWYRAMDLRWEQRKQFEGKKNPAPFFFIGSENDVDLEGFHGDNPLGQLKNQYSDIRAVEMINHAGHMVQMERPEEVNALIVKFLGMLKT